MESIVSFLFIFAREFLLWYYVIMNKTKVAINGFGRIGRSFFRAAYGKEDFDIVEKIINDSYKTMKMDLETGVVGDSHKKSKDSKKDIILLTWGEVMDKVTKSVDRSEYITALGKKEGFNALTAAQAFETITKVYDNETERWLRSG